MRIIALLVILSIFTPFLYLSAQPLSVAVNEIAWMGTEISPNDEWIELYNQSNETINLEGWRLTAQDNTPNINLKGEIKPRGFFILERTDNETLPEITADLIYKGSLENRGEWLKLIDNQDNIIDEINCQEGWLAGDNQTKQTMERTVLDSGWQTSEKSGGTPKAKNSQPQFPKVWTVGTEEKSAEIVTPLFFYPDGVIINEILPSPEGPDKENEYLELFNQNEFAVNLSGWEIKDSAGKTNTFILSGQVIEPKGFLVFYRPQTKITLNNDGDGLILLKPDGEIANEVDYQKATLGQSLNRIGEEWFWSSDLTPGRENTVLREKSEMIEQASVLQFKAGSLISDENSSRSEGRFVFIIALSFSLFSAISVIISKRLLKGKLKARL